MSLRYLTIGALLFSLIGPGLALAAIPKGVIALKILENSGDYLNKVAVPEQEKTLSEKIFDKEITGDLAVRYSRLVDAYESRQNYQLNTMDDQIRFRNENQNLADWAVRRVIDSKVRTPFRKWAWHSVREELQKRVREADLEESTKINERAVSARSMTGASAEETKNSVGAHDAKSGEQTARFKAASRSGTNSSSGGFSILGVYKSLEHFYNEGLRIDDDALMRFQYDAPSGAMDLSLSGAALDTTVNYYVAPVEVSSGRLSLGSSSQEKLGFSVGKSLGVLGLSTGLHYGLGTRTLNYGMSKHIFGPLSAAVNQLHSVANSARDETTYRLSLGLVF